MSKLNLGDYVARILPGPGARNLAYVPGMQNPVFDPLGPGIGISYNWQLVNAPSPFIKRLVVAGQVVGIPTGDFVPGNTGLSTADELNAITINASP